MGMSRLRQGLALRRPACRLSGRNTAVAAALAAALVNAPLGLDAQGPVTPGQKTAEAPKSTAPQPALPSGRSIVDRHLEAIGGRKAVLSHSSTRATGTFSVTSAGMTGAIEVVAAKPDKSLVKINIPGVGDIVEGFDGKNGWTVSAMTGPMLLEGKQLEEKKFDTDFHGELRDESRYKSITTLEQTEFDGRPCYKVRFVNQNGMEDFEFYDVATGLKAGRIATRETPMGRVTGTSIETDYKKFGNLLVPTTVKNTIMGVQQVITINTVEYDTVPPSAFEPPAEIKALIK